MGSPNFATLFNPLLKGKNDPFALGSVCTANIYYTVLIPLD